MEKSKLLIGFQFFKNSLCYRGYYRAKIDVHLLFAEAGNGRACPRALTDLILQLQARDPALKVVVAARKSSRDLIAGTLKERGVRRFRICVYESLSYYRLLWQSHILINNGPFPERFIKREGQFFYCVRERSPEGCLGTFDNQTRSLMANEQRNLLMADALIFPDRACADLYRRAFHLDGICQGALVTDPSPALCASLLDGVREHAAVFRVHRPDQKNVLIYPGPMDLNGMTVSANNLLGMAEGGYTYYVCFRQSYLAPNAHRFDYLHNAGRFIGLSFPQPTLFEIICEVLSARLGLRLPFIRPRIRRYYQREIRRSLPSASFDHVVQFCGYEDYMIELFEHMDANRVIFVHNDMSGEAKSKGNQHIPVLREAYRRYDHVAIVSEVLREGTVKFSGRSDNIQLVENCHDFDRIRSRANEPVTWKPGVTAGTFSDAASLERFLDAHSPVLVTIGRFSAEKKHDLLIRAFEQIKEEADFSNAGLMIIGGYGALFGETLARAEQSACPSDIGVMMHLPNPMPVLARCDLFVLCSRYEGQPMVLVEADVLGVPIVAAEGVGTTSFMEKHKGLLVENSVEGLLDGFRRFRRGGIAPLSFDYETYNRDCLAQFYALLDEKNGHT